MFCRRTSPSGDESARLVTGVDAPELLRAPLIESCHIHQDPPRGERPEEVGGVGDPHRRLAHVAHCEARSDAGRTLDGGRVDTAVHDPPRRVMAGSELDVTGDMGAAHFVDHEARCASEHRRILEGGDIGPGGSGADVSYLVITPEYNHSIPGGLEERH